MKLTPGPHVARILIAVGIATIGAGNSPADDSGHTTEVVLTSDVVWQPLNPARGDKAPKAGTLWGDQTKDGASGFLVKFVDGFSSPPHIHNITYRGVVIAGALHNDDPDAAPMWMPAGSYWMQPAGEVHITAARGASVAFLEIQSGPYLVKPPKESFDNGQRPLNLDATNRVWLDATASDWIDHSDETKKPGDGPELSLLWGDTTEGNVNASLLKLPAGFRGRLSDDSTFRAVVIQGDLTLSLSDQRGDQALTPGSYFGSQEKASHRVHTDDGCLIYVRNEGGFDVSSR
ncbi:DUF4437 domain-containing protein [Crateriforma spongiae]|uniref:DUF4437 domain-containing protein n=1 Tax=Crateriforma spongiae TaxID=2724528 RepID=UPI0014489754|nr:DUF4437 domain-containing protein [Crateriforma spongiae]